MNAAERSLRESLEADAAALRAIVSDRWLIAPDPFGSAMLVPVGAGADPCPVDALPWLQVVDAFRVAHGRPPRPGARALAQRQIASGGTPPGGRNG